MSEYAEICMNMAKSAIIEPFPIANSAMLIYSLESRVKNVFVIKLVLDISESYVHVN